MTNLDSIFKSRDITLPAKVCLVKAMIFPVAMYGCEGWTIKKAEHQRTDAFEPWCWRRCLRVPWTAKGSKKVNPKGNQSWIFIGRTVAEAEAPTLWPPDAKNWLVGKDPDAGKDWKQEKKGTTEDEMVEWHHQLNGHESEQALGVGDRQGSLVCHSPRSRKESDTTGQLNLLTQVVQLPGCCSLHHITLPQRLWFSSKDLGVRASVILPSGKSCLFWRLAYITPLPLQHSTLLFA